DATGIAEGIVDVGVVDGVPTVRVPQADRERALSDGRADRRDLALDLILADLRLALEPPDRAEHRPVRVVVGGDRPDRHHHGEQRRRDLSASPDTPDSPPAPTPRPLPGTP